MFLLILTATLTNAYSADMDFSDICKKYAQITTGNSTFQPAFPSMSASPINITRSVNIPVPIAAGSLSPTSITQIKPTYRIPIPETRIRHRKPIPGLTATPAPIPVKFTDASELTAHALDMAVTLLANDPNSMSRVTPSALDKFLSAAHLRTKIAATILTDYAAYRTAIQPHLDELVKNQDFLNDLKTNINLEYFMGYYKASDKTTQDALKALREKFTIECADHGVTLSPGQVVFSSGSNCTRSRRSSSSDSSIEIMENFT